MPRPAAGTTAQVVRDLLADAADAGAGGRRSPRDRGCRRICSPTAPSGWSSARVRSKSPDWLREIADANPGAIVLAADVRDRRVVTHGWTRELPREHPRPHRRTQRRPARRPARDGRASRGPDGRNRPAADGGRRGGERMAGAGVGRDLVDERSSRARGTRHSPAPSSAWRSTQALSTREFSRRSSSREPHRRSSSAGRRRPRSASRRRWDRAARRSIRRCRSSIT